MGPFLRAKLLRLAKEDPREHVFEFTRFFVDLLFQSVIEQNSIEGRTVSVSWPGYYTTRYPRPVSRATMEGNGEIVIPAEFVRCIFDYFVQMLETGAVFGQYAYLSKVDPAIAARQLGVASHVNKVNFGSMWTAFAVAWASFHEIGHVVHGHNYLTSEKGDAYRKARGVEFDPAAMTPLDWRTLEMDADAFASQHIFRFVPYFTRQFKGAVD